MDKQTGEEGEVSLQSETGEAQINENEGQGQGQNEDSREAGVEENTEKKEEEEEEAGDEPSMNLGEHYEIQMASGKKISGIIYYLDTEKLIRILPDGINHELEDIPIVEVTDPDTGDTYYDLDPQLEISELVLTQKATVSSFIDLIGIRVGQRLVTFKPDRSLGPTLEVTAVNPDKDSIKVTQEDDTFEREIDFNHKGIPLDEEFVIMQIKQDEAPQEDEVEVEPVEVALPMEGDALDFEVLGEIVLPSRVQVQEIAATERMYDERQQKNSFIEDLRTMLDVTTQNNPHVLKNIRTMTEVFSDLKNSILQRDEAGYPRGEKMLSLQTIDDLIKLSSLPIGRPILDTKRVIVNETGATGLDTQFVGQKLPSVIADSVNYIETLGGIEADQDSIGIPRWYMVWSSYFKQFPMGDQYQSGGYTMHHDTEYFRHDAPGTNTTTGLTPIGGVMGMIDKQVKGGSKEFAEGEVGMFTNTIPFSYRRGHGPTLRSLPRGGTELVQVGDKAKQVGTVLFPYEAALNGAMGALRTGNLWEMFKRSFGEKQWMSKLLEEYDEPTDELNIHKIVHITDRNTDVIKTQFIEYLREVLEYIVLYGRGDLYKINADLGMQDLELTTEQVAVVEDKIKKTIGALKHYIGQLRTELAASKEKPTVDPFLGPSILSALQKVLEREAGLEALVKDMNNKTPNYKDIDIAIFSYLLVYAQDYILAAVSGSESAAARERQRFERDQLINILVANRKRRHLEESKGHTPEVNSCRHVRDLNKIRKIKNDSERMAILTQFLVQYDGGMDGNWVKCHRCKKHLICKHEVLQIQQFLHPKEHQILQKQIIMNFAGGRQGEKYICRNCGQPFADIEFDTSLEFNDEGLPMMGRKVLVDKDALEKERIQGLLGIRRGEDEEMKFKNDTQKALYVILQRLVEVVGVEIERASISKLLDMAEREVLGLESEREYTSTKKKLKYIDYKTRRSIAIVASLLLIEIQTHIPNYQVRFAVEGCKPGFGGYPLVDTADPENEDQSIGIQYMTCILNQLYEEGDPWRHGFQTIARDEERRKIIKASLIYYCRDVFATDAAILAMIRAKHEFERNIYGAAAAKGRPSEMLPPGFLPRLETPQEASANAAGTPSVPEGAPRTNLGRLVLADTWIRAANRAIREKGAPNIIKDSPFTETTCCLNSIKEPQSFWNTIALPGAPPLMPTANPFSHQSIAYTAYTARPLQILQETPPEASTQYTVILKLCYKGAHLGMPHEFGADYICDWCDLEVPLQLRNPDINKYGQQIINWEQVRADLDRQGVQVTEQLFQQILDKSHQLNSFSLYSLPKAMLGKEICNYLATIVPQPVPQFKESMDIVIENLPKLKSDESNEVIIQTMIPLSRGPGVEGEQRGLYQLQEDDLKALLGEDFKYLQALLNQSPESIFNVLLTYFVVPAERLATGHTDVLYYTRLMSDLKLGSSHKQEIESILEKHMDYLTTIERDMYGVAKLKNYVTMMSKLFKINQELRANRIRFSAKVSLPAATIFLNKILRIFVISALANLIDPDVMAVDEEGKDVAGGPGNSEAFLQSFVVEMVKKYKTEYLVYNPNIIKQKIEEANEMEHQRFIDHLDKLPQNMRKLEMTKKRLGIGMWAIGGTKATYQYDPDHWEANREAVASSYAQAVAYDPNAQLPAAMQLHDPTGYADPDGMGPIDEGYDYQFYEDDS